MKKAPGFRGLLCGGSNLRASSYGTDPLDRLDYVELGFKPILRVELRGDRLEDCGICCPIRCSS